MEYEIESTDSRISHEAVVEFLMGKTFGKELESMVQRSADFEQGLKVVFLSGKGRYRVMNMDDVSPDSVGGAFVEPEDTPVFDVHTHPVVIGNSLHTFPSGEDLGSSFGEGPFAKAIVIMGSQLQAWVWETPETRRPINIQTSWRRNLRRINDPSYSELEELFDQLRVGGLKVGRGDLERGRLAENLVDLIESIGIRFG